MHVICGPVGTGKSSLLLALLGEMSMHKLNDAIPSFAKRPGLRCLYYSQARWLFRGSVYSNLTLSPSDKTVMNDAELSRFERVGDRQVPEYVAERGSILSGRQRSPLQLTRAVYQDAGLYLFDDPFIGLDVKTSNNIVTNCFQTRSSLLPAHAAVVIVTDSVH
ncbi:hypothetical protein PsorP6_011316 [Peronosclerospora sorghi]|uniref:Uncharacterized protein n=1 Tax=Peronosclerospora sorghi TaxID=230839 RepID=A0ACC0WLZ7_9STRA|nr:hypothetical protein PsorP6_011316 [Peronosclerospora sorghi]